MQLPAHLLGLAHGFAAAVLSLGVFYTAGLLLTPGRWQGSMRWPDSLVLGMTVYVVLCWVAVGSRSIPIEHVTLAFAAIVGIVASIRTRWLQRTIAPRVRSRPARRWLLEFGLFYLLAYILVPPAAGSAVLPLGAGDNISLVTYARYARELLELGTANIDHAAFDYLHSPASMYLLAWQSLMFGRDPLQAAMPVLYLQAALFATIAAETARTSFGLSRPVSLTIAGIAVCGAVFRWALGTYALAEIVAAAAVLYLLRVLLKAAAKRAVTGVVVQCAIAGATLMVFAAPPWAGWGHVLSGLPGLLSTASLMSVSGVPGSAAVDADLSLASRSAAVAVLAAVPIFWGGLVSAAQRWRVLDRLPASDTDRRLARALGVYAAMALILGNVTVQAVRGPEPVRRPAAWRQLHEVSDLPFRALTLKVTDEANGLSTALAMYYLPGRNAAVFGRGVSLQDLSFDNVSKEQPLFIHNFRCEGVGHGDTVFVREVGCLLMAPPGMALGTSYPFDRTFLFVTFDRMTPRQAGGRRNTRSTLHLRVMADPQRTPLDGELFLNLLVNPFLKEGARPQRLGIKWGSGRAVETLIGAREWVSLPVRSADWRGNRLWSLPIALDFLDGQTVLFQEIALTESPRGAVAGTGAHAIETR